MGESSVHAASLVWWSTGKAGPQPPARGWVCKAEVELRGVSQDTGMFVRWEWVKVMRKYFELNEGVWRPWKKSGACSSGLRLGKANGA